MRVSVHISYFERDLTTISCWLGRKDSNLQPSDPESVVLATLAIPRVGWHLILNPAILWQLTLWATGGLNQ